MLFDQLLNWNRFLTRLDLFGFWIGFLKQKEERLGQKGQDEAYDEEISGDFRRRQRHGERWSYGRNGRIWILSGLYDESFSSFSKCRLHVNGNLFDERRYL